VGAVLAEMITLSRPTRFSTSDSTLTLLWDGSVREGLAEAAPYECESIRRTRFVTVRSRT
jgi:hypothetical protein